jgi:hypothetical protein
VHEYRVRGAELSHFIEVHSLHRFVQQRWPHKTLSESIAPALFPWLPLPVH